MQQRGYRECDLREGRYNAVFHLISAAHGAEEFYTLENNEARYEGLEEAREQDEATRKVWVGHPKLCVFDNSTDFEGKLQRLVNATANLVGLPSGLPHETMKFLLSSEPDLSSFPNDVSYQVFNVEKVYLYEDASLNSTLREYSFVRKRTHQNGLGSTYGITTVKISSESSQKIELKRIITKREYFAALRNRDISRYIIRQKRISFLWQMQSFNIHVYQQPVGDLCILHAQSDTTDVDLPPFLDVEKPLKSNEYCSYFISLKNKEQCEILDEIEEDYDDDNEV